MQSATCEPDRRFQTSMSPPPVPANTCFCETAKRVISSPVCDCSLAPALMWWWCNWVGGIGVSYSVIIIRFSKLIKISPVDPSTQILGICLKCACKNIRIQCSNGSDPSSVPETNRLNLRSQQRSYKLWCHLRALRYRSRWLRSLKERYILIIHHAVIIQKYLTNFSVEPITNGVRFARNRQMQEFSVLTTRLYSVLLADASLRI